MNNRKEKKKKKLAHFRPFSLVCLYYRRSSDDYTNSVSLSLVTSYIYIYIYNIMDPLTGCACIRKTHLLIIFLHDGNSWFSSFFRNWSLFYDKKGLTTKIYFFNPYKILWWMIIRMFEINQKIENKNR